MAKLLLLYDTKEEDFARDLEEFLNELNIGTVIRIPASTDKGKGLEDKEDHYFKDADGLVFLITPGSARDGMLFASPSVNIELGVGKEKFKSKQECVNFLVDSQCQMPVIHQKAHIPFTRGDVRSIISAMTRLVRNLKEAGLLTKLPDSAMASGIGLQELFEKLDEKVRGVVFFMSNQQDGFTSNLDVEKKLRFQYENITIQDINFIKRDLTSNSIAGRIIQTNFDYWFLTERGWEIARLERDQQREHTRGQISAVLKLIGIPSKK